LFLIAKTPIIAAVISNPIIAHEAKATVMVNTIPEIICTEKK